MSERNYASLLDRLKDHRRFFVQRLDEYDTQNIAAELTQVQTCITAVEAVMAEPVVKLPPSHIEFGEDGWPIEAGSAA